MAENRETGPARSGAAPGLSEVSLLTIIAEPVVQPRLVRDINDAGARGYTITTATGEGSRSRRVSDIDGGSLRVEVLAASAVIETLMGVLERDYFPHYAVVAWVSPAFVSRAEKFV